MRIPAFVALCAAKPTFTVMPVGAGSCRFTITGGDGKTATLSIGVTTTSGGGG